MANRFTVAATDSTGFRHAVVDGDNGFMMTCGSSSNAHYYAEKFNGFIDGVRNGYDPLGFVWTHLDGSVAWQPVYDDDDNYEDGCECDDCLCSRGECGGCYICEEDD